MLQPMSHLMDNLHESSIIRPVLAMQHLSRPWKVGIGAVDALQLHSMTLNSNQHVLNTLN